MGAPFDWYVEVRGRKIIPRSKSRGNFVILEKSARLVFGQGSSFMMHFFSIALVAAYQIQT